MPAALNRACGRRYPRLPQPRRGAVTGGAPSCSPTLRSPNPEGAWQAGGLGAQCPAACCHLELARAWREGGASICSSAGGRPVSQQHSRRGCPCSGARFLPVCRRLPPHARVALLWASGSATRACGPAPARAASMTTTLQYDVPCGPVTPPPSPAGQELSPSLWGSFTPGPSGVPVHPPDPSGLSSQRLCFLHGAAVQHAFSLSFTFAPRLMGLVWPFPLRRSVSPWQWLRVLFQSG